MAAFLFSQISSYCWLGPFNIVLLTLCRLTPEAQHKNKEGMIMLSPRRAMMMKQQSVTPIRKAGST
jgi:hypothetical protein